MEVLSSGVDLAFIDSLTRTLVELFSLLLPLKKLMSDEGSLGFDPVWSQRRSISHGSLRLFLFPVVCSRDAVDL
jgi:hypothetical protein